MSKWHKFLTEILWFNPRDGKKFYMTSAVDDRYHVYRNCGSFLNPWVMVLSYVSYDEAENKIAEIQKEVAEHTNIVWNSIIDYLPTEQSEILVWFPETEDNFYGAQYAIWYDNWNFMSDEIQEKFDNGEITPTHWSAVNSP